MHGEAGEMRRVGEDKADRKLGVKVERRLWRLCKRDRLTEARLRSFPSTTTNEEQGSRISAAAFPNFVTEPHVVHDPI
jgi:hypothetical protein